VLREMLRTCADVVAKRWVVIARPVPRGWLEGGWHTRRGGKYPESCRLG